MPDDPTHRTADLTVDPLTDESAETDQTDQTDQIARELDEDYPPPRDLSREATLASAVLTVAAAVLCVFAPFRAVYTLRAGGISASFDGWGRYDFATSNQHGPRYGIALTVAALVLVIAAASRLRDLRPVFDINADGGGLVDPDTSVDAVDDTGPESDGFVAADEADPVGEGGVVRADRDADRVASGVGIAGSALLLGVLGSVALSIESTVSNANSIAADGGTATAVDVGAMLWVLVGAWVVSVVAVWLPWVEARRRTRG